MLNDLFGLQAQSECTYWPLENGFGLLFCCLVCCWKCLVIWWSHICFWCSELIQVLKSLIINLFTTPHSLSNKIGNLSKFLESTLIFLVLSNFKFYQINYYWYWIYSYYPSTYLRGALADIYSFQISLTPSCTSCNLTIFWGSFQLLIIYLVLLLYVYK